jgi:hypothetical protein
MTDHSVSRPPQPTVIAIDPGGSGGIAYQHPGGAVCAATMPATEGDIVELLDELIAEPGAAVAFVEEVGGFIEVTLKTADALLLLDYALRQLQQENQKQKGPRA